MKALHDLLVFGEPRHYFLLLPLRLVGAQTYDGGVFEAPSNPVDAG